MSTEPALESEVNYNDQCGGTTRYHKRALARRLATRLGPVPNRSETSTTPNKGSTPGNVN
jgi:hypothetical protein